MSAHFMPPWPGKFVPGCFHPSQDGYRDWVRAVLSALPAPSGYTVSPSSPAALGDVAAGASVSQTWTVTVPADAASGAAHLYQAAVFGVPGPGGSTTPARAGIG